MIFGYPVTEQQLIILNFFGFRGDISLWILRILSLFVLIFVLYLWYIAIGRFVPKLLAKFSVVFIFISPLFFILWMIFPIICIKLLLFALGMHLLILNRRYFALLAVCVILFNVFVVGNNPAVFNKLDFGDAQLEVTKRISSEDGLKESIYIPLFIRRISYNKIFITYKQVVGEIIPFFDFESIFFQEINPLSQKSIVMFYWPEFYLFILGLYYLYNLKNKKLNAFLFLVFGLSLFDFVFSEGPVFGRLVLVIFPLSVIIGLAFYNLFLLTKKSNLFGTLAFVGVSLFTIFGYFNLFYDLSKRTDYWLDNRPMAYNFWFAELTKIDLNKFDKVVVTGIIGNTKDYCLFYLGKICNSNKFVFDSFDLTKVKSLNTVYAGFSGEFVGPDFKNDISGDWYKTTLIKIVAKKSLRDTVANKYGNDVGVGISN